MSVRVMSWVWDHSQAHGADRLVLLAIADAADDDGWYFDGLDVIARKANVPPVKAHDVVSRLVDGGRLTRSDEGLHVEGVW